MLSPSRSKVEIVSQSPSMLVARCASFDITMLGNTAAVPASGYDIGTIQFIDTGTSLSTGVIKAVVCNDSGGDVFVAHPTSATLSAAGVTAAVNMDYTYFGAQVTTIQGTAGGSSVIGELWITLKARRTI